MSPHVPTDAERPSVGPGGGGTHPRAAASVWDALGGFIAQAGSFPHDTPSAREFVRRGGRWLLVQLGDTEAEHDANVNALEGDWARKWRADGVEIGGWDRTNQIKTDEGLYAIAATEQFGLDLWAFNPEDPPEIARLHDSLRTWRRKYPRKPVAAVTVGKPQGFPTGALAELDAHVILECFLETPTADTTVINSVTYMLRSQVPLDRIHCALLFKTGYLTPVVEQAQEADEMDVKGLSAFTAENTPTLAWRWMA